MLCVPCCHLCPFQPAAYSKFRYPRHRWGAKKTINCRERHVRCGDSFPSKQRTPNLFHCSSLGPTYQSSAIYQKGTVIFVLCWVIHPFRKPTNLQAFGYGHILEWIARVTFTCIFPIDMHMCIHTCTCVYKRMYGYIFMNIERALAK